MSAPATPARALFAHVGAPPFGLPEVRMDGRRSPAEMPTVPVHGAYLSREKVAAALFEIETDEYGLPGITTETLWEFLAASVTVLGPVKLMQAAESFSRLDNDEFPEVGQCRLFAYRLCLHFWYVDGDTRPMTAGEAAAALYLSGYGRTHQPRPAGPRALGRMVREGAGQVPTSALVRVGRALTADLVGLPDRSADSSGNGAWLYSRLLPDRSRATRCLDLVRGRMPIPLPLMVRLDFGGYRLGATPPPGPGNRWLHPLREEW